MEPRECEVAPGTLVSRCRRYIYLSVVDREGNMVSLIESNYASFWLRMVADGTGSFCMIAARCSASIPPLRTRSRATSARCTLSSRIQQKDQVRIAFGIMGGWNQAQAHAQFVSHVVDFTRNSAAPKPRVSRNLLRRMRCGSGESRPGNVRADSKPRPQAHHAQRLLGYIGGGQAVMRDMRLV